MDRRFFAAAVRLSLALLLILPTVAARGLDQCDLGDVALLATNSVEIKRNAAVSGDVVVDAAAAGPTLVAGFEAVLARGGSVSGAIRANRIQLANGSTVDDLFYNLLDDKGATINGTQASPLTLPVFTELPPFVDATFRTGEVDVVVAAGTIVTLAAGDYGTVEIAEGGVLELTGGTYNFRSVAPISTAGGQCPFPCRSVSFLAPSDVRVEGRFDTGKDSFVGPGGAAASASNVLLYVGGSNGGTGLPGDLPPAATFGRDSVAEVTVYAPRGTLLVDRDSSFTGAGLARDIRIDLGVTVAVDSAFANRPPLATPQSVFTAGAAPLDLTLVGSDPEGGNLAFSIESFPTEGQLGPLDPIEPVQTGRCSISTSIVCTDFAGSSDCPVGETCEAVGGLLPITSAETTYTPATDENREDSFVFKVTDECGAMGTATVSINAPGDPTPPPPTLDEIVAYDVSVETRTDTPVTVPLSADGPEGVALTLSITSLPAGSLATTGGTPIETVPFDLADSAVVYTPPSGFTGPDSFLYEARGTIGGVVESAGAQASIEVFPAPPLAQPVQATTNLNQPVLVTLQGNSGGTGETPGLGPLSLGMVLVTRNQTAGSTVAGNVSDADGDGFGDGRDNLPGSAPVLVAAGVDVNLGATPSGSVTDPAGDATDDSRVTPDPDLVAATVASDGIDITFSVRFDPPTFNASLSRASFVLDTDENPATGFPGVDAANNDAALMGIEFLVDIGADLGATAEVLKFIAPPNSFSTVGTFTATVLADGYDVTIPLSAFDGDDGRLTFKVETQSFLGPGYTGILDYMPDLGLAPGQAKTGIQGVARVQIEWRIDNLGLVGDEVESASVELTTEKGTVDDLDTFFFAGTADQDGLLRVFDFEAPAAPLPGVVMPVPAGAQTGDEGTFSFDVTGALKAAIDRGDAFFSVQGRVDEGLAGGGFRRGLQVHSSASGNLTAGKEPKLQIVTGEPKSPLSIKLLTAPSNGILTDQAGFTVSAGTVFPETSSLTLVYSPSFGFSGPDSFTYQVTEGLVVSEAIVDLTVLVTDGCTEVGRPPGCAPAGE